MVGEDPDGPRIPIPFDFDMSGLVNASYAAPPSHLPIRDVRFPYYTGLCQPPGILDETIAHANSKREEIFALFSNSKELTPKAKSTALTKVENFFNVINTPKRRRRELDDHCRGEKLLEEMLNPTKEST